MSLSTNKLVCILLALTLISPPLQSALAGLDIHASCESGQQNIHDTDAGIVHGDDGRMMSAGCKHCTEQNGCKHHNCTHSHCTTCTPGLLGLFQSDLTNRGTDIYQWANQILLNHESRKSRNPGRFTACRMCTACWRVIDQSTARTGAGSGSLQESHQRLQSCHTVQVGDYVIADHEPKPPALMSEKITVRVK